MTDDEKWQARESGGEQNFDAAQIKTMVDAASTILLIRAGHLYEDVREEDKPAIEEARRQTDVRRVIDPECPSMLDTIREQQKIDDKAAHWLRNVAAYGRKVAGSLTQVGTDYTGPFPDHFAEAAGISSIGALIKAVETIEAKLPPQRGQVPSI